MEAAAAADDLLRGGREALAAADLQRARSCFEHARALRDSAEALDGLSQVLHSQGEYDPAIELKERAFAACRRRGRRVEAAEAARRLAFLHVSVHGNPAAANGWMARAESLLAGEDECAAHGRLTLDWAPFSRDPSERARLAEAALIIARRFGDADLEFDALALLGEAYVASGRAVEGMKLLDEAIAAVSAGEVARHASPGRSAAWPPRRSSRRDACRRPVGTRGRPCIFTLVGNTRSPRRCRLADDSPNRAARRN